MSGPALYLGSGPDGLARVLRFCAGVLAVYLSAGLAVTLGPGELILDLVPRPGPVLEDWLQVGAGAILLIGSALVWRSRGRLGQREPGSRDRGTRQRSSLLLGAGIAAVGLPTNVAYLGAIATIVGSDRDVTSQVLLIAIYVAIFVQPLCGILGVLALMPRRADQLLGGLRRLFQRRWVPVLAAVLALAGAVVVTLGVTGLWG